MGILVSEKQFFKPLKLLILLLVLKVVSSTTTK